VRKTRAVSDDREHGLRRDLPRPSKCPNGILRALVVAKTPEVQDGWRIGGSSRSKSSGVDSRGNFHASSPWDSDVFEVGDGLVRLGDEGSRGIDPAVVPFDKLENSGERPDNLAAQSASMKVAEEDHRGNSGNTLGSPRNRVSKIIHDHVGGMGPSQHICRSDVWTEGTSEPGDSNSRYRRLPGSHPPSRGYPVDLMAPSD